MPSESKPTPSVVRQTLFSDGLCPIGRFAGFVLPSPALPFRYGRQQETADDYYHAETGRRFVGSGGGGIYPQQGFARTHIAGGGAHDYRRGGRRARVPAAGVGIAAAGGARHPRVGRLAHHQPRNQSRRQRDYRARHGLRRRQDVGHRRVARRLPCRRAVP